MAEGVCEIWVLVITLVWISRNRNHAVLVISFLTLVSQSGNELPWFQGTITRVP